MKSIMSEKTIKSKNFKIKIGTLNKKRPSTMYLEAGTYIKPTAVSESYKSHIVEIEKEMKLKAKEVIKTLPWIEKDFLLITDVAVNRIDTARKTHYTVQFYFKPNQHEIVDFHKTFNQLADEFVLKYGETFPTFQDIITTHGFVCSKTK